MNFMNKHLFFLENKWIVGTLILLFLYLSPLFIYGQNLNILVFDNLDSNVAWFKVLADSGMIFASNNAIVPNIMGGLSRSAYGSEFDVLLWFYYFFTPFTAYVLNEVVMHIVAYISMYIFLDKYLFIYEDKEKRKIYSSIGALYFSVLPFWPSAGLSVPLMPLVTYSLLKIKAHKDTWKDWILLVLLPLYSSFILVYFFYIALVGIYLIRQSLIQKSVNKHMLLAIILMIIVFLLKEYRLVIQMFFEQEFISNRTEYTFLVNESLISSYRYALLDLLDGVPHARGIHRDLLLPGAFFAMALSVMNRKLTILETIVFLVLIGLTYYFGLWQIIFRQLYTIPMLLIITLIFIAWKKYILAYLLFAQIIISLWLGFSFYEGWNAVFDYFPGLRMFNFSRFFFVSSMLWAMIAAVIIQIIYQKIQFRKMTIIIFTLFFMYVAQMASFFNTNVIPNHLPYNKYYAEKQFYEIEKYIAKSKKEYKIICFGFEPSIAQYNGFHTLGGYMVNYPLDYKHKFRKIISQYLDKDEVTRGMFDGWGSKLYMFDNNVVFTYTNIFVIKALSIYNYSNLNFDSKQIAKMGGQYIFSSHVIETPEKYNIKFLKTFSDDNSLWELSIYEVLK